MLKSYEKYIFQIVKQINTIAYEFPSNHYFQNRTQTPTTDAPPTIPLQSRRFKQTAPLLSSRETRVSAHPTGIRSSPRRTKGDQRPAKEPTLRKRDSEDGSRSSKAVPPARPGMQISHSGSDLGPESRASASGEDKGRARRGRRANFEPVRPRAARYSREFIAPTSRYAPPRGILSAGIFTRRGPRVPGLLFTSAAADGDSGWSLF